MCCLFILCFTRAAEKPLLRLGHTCASWAALSLMLLALNAVTLRPLVELSINPASILLCVLTALAAMKSSGFLSLLKALALAVPAGLLMLAISRLMASGYINLAEPGLVLALCGTVFMAMLRQSPAAALFGVSLFFIYARNACCFLYHGAFKGAPNTLSSAISAARHSSAA